MISPERRARLLLRCYPRVWRQRYGDEFADLLIDDLAERPRSLARDVDVVRAALRARITAWGLAAGPLQDGFAVRFVAAAATAFFVLGALSVWTQLADGWLTAPPESQLVNIGLVSLSIWLGVLLLAALAGSVRLGLAVARTVRAGRTAELIQPLTVLVGSAAVLVAGVRLMAPLWPGARATHDSGLLPFAARVGWASTDTISTYRLHPHRLFGLPGGELTWMLVFPVALIGVVSAMVDIARVSSVNPPRSGGRVSAIGGVAAMPGLVTAAAWVLGSQHASRATYRSGTLDLVLVTLMLVAALVARKAVNAQPVQPH